MFFRSKTTSPGPATLAETEASSSRQNVAAAERETDSKKNSCFKMVMRFHRSMKDHLYSDSVMGRSLANLEEVVKIRRRYAVLPLLPDRRVNISRPKILITLSREFMLYTLGVLLLLSFLIGIFGRHMSNLLCIPYPMVVSTICIDSNVTRRYIKWITYWIIFGTVNIADMLCPIVYNLLPQFYLWRTVFLAWCFSPYQWNGCKVIRENLCNTKNMRILRVVAYVGYEGGRFLTTS